MNDWWLKWINIKIVLIHLSMFLFVFVKYTNVLTWVISLTDKYYLLGLIKFSQLKIKFFNRERPLIPCEVNLKHLWWYSLVWFRWLELGPGSYFIFPCWTFASFQLMLYSLLYWTMYILFGCGKFGLHICIY